MREEKKIKNETIRQLNSIQFTFSHSRIKNRELNCHLAIQK
jgi:hypothetical protein